MFEISRMRTYSQRDLAELLGLCTDHLAAAYQELCIRDLSRLSIEAYSAAEFKSCMAEQGHPNHHVH